MSAESELRGRIETSQEVDGPFNSNELNGSMAWIWDWDRTRLDKLIQQPDSQRVFNEILDWFDIHPSTNASLNIGMPPRSQLPAMTEVDRLVNLRDMLGRRDQILRKFPNEMRFDLSNHQLYMEPETSVPEAGAVKFVVSVDVTPLERMSAKMKIGQITVDIPDGILRINEVQRKDPSFGEEYQLEQAGISKDELEKKLRTKKKRIRDIVKDNRLLPIVAEMQIAWPLIEELMISQSVKALTQIGVIGRDAPVQLLHEREIMSSLDDPYTFDSVFDQTIGRAIIELGTTAVNGLLLTKKDRAELMKDIDGDRSLGDRADSAGYLLHYSFKFPGKDEELRKLLRTRLLRTGFEQESKFANLPLMEYAYAMLPYTTDYFTNYAPYFLSFMDLSKTNQPDGRILTQRGLATLPFWKQLEITGLSMDVT